MLKIGITGGIGSGKTTVAKVFEVLGVPVTDFDPYCLKHGAERRELFKLATREDAGLKRSALLKYFLPKKPSEKRRSEDLPISRQSG